MRRFGLRRCAARGEKAAADVDLSELRRADEELDALRSPEEGRSDDPVLHLLGALATDVDSDDTDEPPRKPAPRKRRLVSRAAVTTGLTVAALSGTGVAAAAVVISGVGPWQPLQQQVQALHDRGESASPRDVRAAISEARSALDAGRLGDAGRALHRARAGWATMDGPRDARVKEAIHQVEMRLARARQKASPEGQGRALAGGPSGHDGEERTRASAPEGSTARDPAASASDDGGDGASRTAAAGSSTSSSPSPSEGPSGKCRADDGGKSDGGQSGNRGQAEDGEKPGNDCRSGGDRSDDSGRPDDSGQSGGGRSDDSGQSGGGRSDDSGQSGGGQSGGGQSGGGQAGKGSSGVPSGIPSPSATP